MRPTISATWALPSSSVIFSLETSRPIWPSVTLPASVKPASTNSCLTSLRTTSIPAAAMVWAIWPPMVPAPTTAALKTNMARTLWAAGRFSFRGELAREPGQRAGKRLTLARADEQRVHHRREGAELALFEAIAQLQGQPHPLLVQRGERDRLRAGHRRVVDLGHLLDPRLLAHDLLHDAAAAAGGPVPDDRPLRGPAGIGAGHVVEAVDEGRPAAGVVPQRLGVADPAWDDDLRARFHVQSSASTACGEAPWTMTRTRI